MNQYLLKNDTTCHISRTGSENGENVLNRGSLWLRCTVVIIWHHEMQYTARSFQAEKCSRNCTAETALGEEILKRWFKWQKHAIFCMQRAEHKLGIFLYGLNKHMQKLHVDTW